MDIEQIGTSAVSRLIAKSDYIVANVADKDRGPSWDGNLEVYKKAGHNHSKADLIITIPIQVKGHIENNLRKKSITYPVNIADMRNFLQIGGTVFFVVYTDEDGEKDQVYYLPLLPFEMKKILDKHGHQQTKNMKFTVLPKQKNALTDVFLAVAHDIKKQKPTVSCESVTMEELAKSGQLKEITLGYTSLPKKYDFPLDYFFNHGAYVYAKLPYGLELPVSHMDRLESAQTTVDADVSVNGKTYYSEYTLIYKKDVVEVCFGKSTVHRINRTNNQTQQFTFELKGTLTERIRDLEFIIAAIGEKQFMVGDIVCPLDQATPEELASFDVPKRKEHLEWLKKAKQVLDALRVTKDLDVSVMTEKDDENLRVLHTAIMDKQTVKLNDPGNVFGTFKIANLKIMVCVLNRHEGKNLYNIYDFNDVPVQVRAHDDKGVEHVTSHYVLLKKETLLECCNIDYNEMVKHLKSITMSEVYAGHVVALLLEMLKAYDESNSKRADILDAATRITDWMRTADTTTPAEVLTLNYYQAIKRTRKFTEEEIAELLTIVESGTDKNDVLAGVHLLLDNQAAASIYYKRMDDSMKELFRYYPIFHFWKDDSTEVNPDGKNENGVG